MQKLKHSKIVGLLREAGLILRRIKKRKPPKRVIAKLKRAVRRKFGKKTRKFDINTS
jgi:hypothetical protein